MKVDEIRHLGKDVNYEEFYNPNLLQAISRVNQRKSLGLEFDGIDMYGVDIWNNYECSWINNRGKPNVGIIRITYPSNSINIIESKSMKLYFMSFNNTVIDNSNQLINIISKDISSLVSARVDVDFISVDTPVQLQSLPGTNIDYLDVVCESYLPNSDLLFSHDEFIIEELNSNLLKSNCKITKQPDWASIYIKYSGNKINHENLLKYIISYRNFNDFHEQCIEKIYLDIMSKCKPKELTIFAKYTRRGGIDISPYRTNIKNFSLPPYVRTVRQ